MPLDNFGLSSNFIEAFNQYKNEKKLDHINLLIRGNNISRDFLYVENIIPDETNSQSGVYKMIKKGGITNYFKIFNPYEFGNFLNKVNTEVISTYNFSKHLEKAISRKIATKDNYVVKLNQDFFSPIDDFLSNYILFESRFKFGHLIDIDTFSMDFDKKSYDKRYEINQSMNRMFINVNHISSSQNERSGFTNELGFYVINTPNKYIPSLGLRGFDVFITRRKYVNQKDTVILK